MSDFDFFKEFDETSDKEDEGDDIRVSQREGTVFLIDAREPMLQDSQNGKSFLFTCLELVLQTLKNKIISSEDDILSLCLYGTKEKKNTHGFEHVYVLQDMDYPYATRIKTLEKIIASSQLPPEIGSLSSSDNFKFHHALWTASSLLTSAPEKLGKRRVLLFTNDDNPTCGRDENVDQSFTKAKDLFDNHIILDIFGMHPPGGTFRKDLFFGPLVMDMQSQQASSQGGMSGAAAASSSVRGSASGGTLQSTLPGFSSGASFGVSASMALGQARTTQQPPTNNTLQTSLAFRASGQPLSSAAAGSSRIPGLSAGSGSNPSSGRGSLLPSSGRSMPAPTLAMSPSLAEDKDDDELEPCGSITIVDVSTKIQELKEGVRKRQHRRRTLARQGIRIGGGASAPEIAVRAFALVSRTTKGSVVYYHKDDRTDIKTTTVLCCPTTGAVLHDLKNELYMTYKVGEDVAAFTPDENATFRRHGVESGIEILGFKPQYRLKLAHNVKHAIFFYPDEHRAKGSRAAFAALRQKMMEKRMIAICRYTRGQLGVPQLVALLADPEGPPGLHGIFLPYANDIRKIPEVFEVDVPDPTDEMLDAAKTMINQLTLPNFTPLNYPSPSLQRHYTTLQALALDEEVDETFDEDSTLPNEDMFDQNADAILQFKRKTLGDDFEEAYEQGAAKKPRTSATSAPAVSSDDVVAMFRRGELKKLRVVDLKAFVNRNNLQANSNKKADLLQAASEFLSENAG